MGVCNERNTTKFDDLMQGMEWFFRLLAVYTDVHRLLLM